MPENEVKPESAVTDVPAQTAEVTTPPPSEAEAPAQETPPPAPERVSEQAAEGQQPAVTPAAPEVPKVKVDIPPPEPKKEFRPRPRPQQQQDRPRSRNPEDIAAFIAKKNAEHMEILENAGYQPVAVNVIVNGFATKESGYEKVKSRDHLMLMLETVADALRYGIDYFTINEASVLDSLLNAALAELLAVDGLLTLGPDEGYAKVMSVFDTVWKRKERIMGDNVETFATLKRMLLRAINAQHKEGFAGRARYLLECIIFVRANQVEVFAGMFHTDRIQAPGYVLRKLGIGNNEPKPCPKCGKPMKYWRYKHRFVCSDPMCENWEDATPPWARNRDGEGGEPAAAPERISKKHRGGYDSGKPISTESGAERFKKRFQKKQFTPEQKANFEKKKAERAAMEAMARENNEKIAKGQQDQWAALDKLKLGDGNGEQAAPAAEAPAPEPAGDQLPPPPAEIPASTSAGEPDVPTTSSASGNPPDGVQVGS